MFAPFKVEPYVMRRDGEWQKEGFGEANTLCRVNEL